MNFLLFILICYGMTQIVTTSKIFEPIRNRYNIYILSCSMCSSFWIGLLVFLVFWFCGIQLFPNLYLGSLFFGCISSATSFGLISLIGEDGLHINIG